MPPAPLHQAYIKFLLDSATFLLPRMPCRPRGDSFPGPPWHLYLFPGTSLLSDSFICMQVEDDSASQITYFASLRNVDPGCLSLLMVCNESWTRWPLKPCPLWHPRCFHSWIPSWGQDHVSVRINECTLWHGTELKRYNRVILFPPCVSSPSARPQRLPPLPLPGVSFKGHSGICKPRMWLDLGQIGSPFVFFEHCYAIVQLPHNSNSPLSTLLPTFRLKHNVMINILVHVLLWTHGSITVKILLVELLVQKI